MPHNRNLKKPISTITLFLFLILPAQAFSQAANASLRGTVKDSHEGVVQNATVTLTNDGTEISIKAVSDNKGRFNFLGLDPGVYTLVIEHSQFKTLKIIEIELNAKDVKSIRVEMTDYDENPY